MMNQFAFGFHPVRTGFIGSTLLFLGYLLWRRALFSDTPQEDLSRKPASQESP